MYIHNMYTTFGVFPIMNICKVAVRQLRQNNEFNK